MKMITERSFQIGRALGVSILDLTNSNPPALSRLANSEFRTLQGLRNALRLDIEKSFNKNQILIKVRNRKSCKKVEETHDFNHVLQYFRPGRD